MSQTITLKAKSVLTAGAAALVILSSFVPNITHAQAAVTIDDAALQAVIQTCANDTSTDGDGGCSIAIDALVAQLAAVNPNVDVGSIISAVASTVAASYNAGAVPATVAATVFRSVQSVATTRGATAVAAAASSLVQAATTGAQADIDTFTAGVGSSASAT